MEEQEKRLVALWRVPGLEVVEGQAISGAVEELLRDAFGQGKRRILRLGRGRHRWRAGVKRRGAQEWTGGGRFTGANVGRSDPR